MRCLADAQLAGLEKLRFAVDIDSSAAGAVMNPPPSGAAFVGIDSLNIDDMADLARPAHAILLGAGIPICEHMTNLVALPRDSGHLHAVPIAWQGGATFPVRAYVQL